MVGQCLALDWSVENGLGNSTDMLIPRCLLLRIPNCLKNAAALTSCQEVGTLECQGTSGVR